MKAGPMQCTPQRSCTTTLQPNMQPCVSAALIPAREGAKECSACLKMLGGSGACHLTQVGLSCRASNSVLLTSHLLDVQLQKGGQVSWRAASAGHHLGRAGCPIPRCSIGAVVSSGILVWAPRLPSYHPYWAGTLFPLLASKGLHCSPVNPQPGGSLSAPPAVAACR